MEYTIKHKQVYLKGYFSIKRFLKKFHDIDITPNEYYSKYVKKTTGDEPNDEFGRIYEKIPDTKNKKIHLYKVTDDWKYLIAILPL